MYFYQYIIINIFLKYNLHAIKFILSKCKIQWVLVYSQGYTTITTIQFPNNFFMPKRTSLCISKIFLLSVIPVSGNINLLSDSMDLSVLNFTSVLNSPCQHTHVQNTSMHIYTGTLFSL